MARRSPLLQVGSSIACITCDIKNARTGKLLAQVGLSSRAMLRSLNVQGSLTKVLLLILLLPRGVLSGRGGTPSSSQEAAA